jgi:hypothetical protein
MMSAFVMPSYAHLPRLRITARPAVIDAGDDGPHRDTLG